MNSQQLYKQEAHFRCANADCGNLYIGQECPLCHENRPNRPTMVWVRGEYIEESLDESRHYESTEIQEDEEEEEEDD